MILLTVVTSSGPRVAAKTPEGIVILEEAQRRQQDTLPLTLGEALFTAGGVDRIRSFVQRSLGSQEVLPTSAVPEANASSVSCSSRECAMHRS